MDNTNRPLLKEALRISIKPEPLASIDAVQAAAIKYMNEGRELLPKPEDMLNELRALEAYVASAQPRATPPPTDLLPRLEWSVVMRYRKLDANGDYSFGQAAPNFWHDVPDAVAQLVVTRFAMWQGEWWLDTGRRHSVQNRGAWQIHLRHARSGVEISRARYAGVMELVSLFQRSESGHAVLRRRDGSLTRTAESVRGPI